MRLLFIPAMLTVLFLAGKPLIACTVFSASLNGIILAGNNEDWYDSHSKICFYPEGMENMGGLFSVTCMDFPREE